MKYILLFNCMFLLCRLSSQEIPLELMLGQENFYSQFSVSKKTKINKIGFSNASSYSLFYSHKRKSELMSQTYITVRLWSNMKVGIGTFYASVPGLKPSINFQYFKMYRNFSIIIVPRIDIRNYPSTDLMLMTEYKPKLTDHLKLYSRLQAMFSYNLPKHSRSYQYFRIGFEIHGSQFGLGLNLDAYGKTYNYFTNYGFFYKQNL